MTACCDTDNMQVTLPCLQDYGAAADLVQASVGDLREVVMLIVVANIVCQRIQRAIVAVCLLALQ